MINSLKEVVENAMKDAFKKKADKSFEELKKNFDKQLEEIKRDIELQAQKMTLELLHKIDSRGISVEFKL